MTVPDGVRCNTCMFWQETRGGDGFCHIDLNGTRTVYDDRCGHHPLWQEIARREAAAKLDPQTVTIQIPVEGHPNMVHTVKGTINP